MNTTRLTLLGVLAPVLLGGALAAQSPPKPSGGALAADQACFDVDHYALRLRVDPADRTITGRLTMQADLVADTSRLALDLDGALQVTGVTVERPGGDAATATPLPASHRHADGRITIQLEDELPAGTRVAVTVDYGGAPHVATNPPWNGGFTWAETPAGDPWIATSCQGEGADLWWPCKDHPSDEPRTMDLHITVPEGLIVASNGTLRDRSTEGGWTTFHWHVANPINNYCVALNIAPYELLESEYESVTGERFPVMFWVLPGNEAKGRALLEEIEDHLRHMEETCGPYPFRNEKYGVAETPHLGMEHQTIIAYGYGFRKQDPGYDWLHHHEMSHEWWANLVTCRDWKDMWIHEGIGTYMQALYVESRFGEEAFRRTMRGQRRGLLNRKAVAPRESQNSREIYFSASGNDIYYKGSWICHSLRWLVGDETFSTILRRWAYPDPASESVTDGSQTRLTDTDELLEIANTVAGRDLGWFFDLYLHQPHLPRLVTETDGNRLHLRWETPGDLPFPMPVAVRIGDRVLRVECPEGEATVELPEGTEWTVDPDGWLLREERRRR